MSAVQGVITFLVGTVIVGIFVNLLSDQAKGELRKVGNALVERAAERLPEEHRGRWLDEWKSDLHEKYLVGPFSGIAYAVKIVRDAPRLARELVPMAEAAGESSTVPVEDRPGRPRRLRLLAVLARAAGFLRSAVRSGIRVWSASRRSVDRTLADRRTREWYARGLTAAGAGLAISGLAGLITTTSVTKFGAWGMAVAAVALLMTLLWIRR